MGSLNGTGPTTLVARRDADHEFDLAHILGLPIEFLLYGIYIFSFVVSLGIIFRQRRQFTFSSKIFVYSNILLFITATIHAALGLSRLVQAFITNPDGPAAYFNYPSWNMHWENLAFYILIFIMMNTADALVIYRCYIIWSRNFYVIILPVLLALSSFAAGIPMFISFGHPTIIPNSTLLALLSSVYPIHFSQNILTTGLIVWRLWMRHRASTKAGVRTLGATLMQTARIIIESAMIYTLILLGLIILDVRESHFLSTVQYVLVPTIGIVFNLISIRVYVAQSSAVNQMPSTNLLPRFNSVTTSQDTGLATIRHEADKVSLKGSVDAECDNLSSAAQATPPCAGQRIGSCISGDSDKYPKSL